MKIKTKWKTKCCGRCGEHHTGYTGKFDKNGIEYVVCGTGEEGNSFAFPTEWVKEELS
jgi:hypothetical protein